MMMPLGVPGGDQVNLMERGVISDMVNPPTMPGRASSVTLVTEEELTHPPLEHTSTTYSYSVNGERLESMKVREDVYVWKIATQFL